MKLVVLICGSRDWNGWEEAELIKEELRQLPPNTIIIHGAAPGADSLAGFEADLMGFDVRGVSADWDKFGLEAGPIRNRKMLTGLLKARTAGYEIRVIAFHYDPKLGKGTRDMVGLAEAHDFSTKKVIKPVA
jgi:hypothetical protein